MPNTWNTGLWKFRLPGKTWKIVVLIEGLAGLFVGLVFVVGPLWPVGHLFLLHSSDEILAREGVYNPRTQRLFCWYALGCLIIGGLFFWLGWHLGREFYLGTAIFWSTYFYVTYAVFEWKIWRKLQAVNTALKESGALIIILVGSFMLYIVELFSAQGLEGGDYE